MSVHDRYSPPQSPMDSNISILLLLDRTCSIASWSSWSRDHPKLAKLESVCSLIPMRAPTMTAPTYGKSRTHRVATLDISTLCLMAMVFRVFKRSWKRAQSPQLRITPWYCVE